MSGCDDTALTTIDRNRSDKAPTRIWACFKIFLREHGPTSAEIVVS